MKKKDSFLALVVLYRIVLDWSYFLLSQYPRYAVQFSLDVNSFKLITSYLIIAITCLLTYNSSDIIAFFERMIFFFVITPISSVYALRNENGIFFFGVIICFSAIVLILGGSKISFYRTSKKMYDIDTCYDGKAVNFSESNIGKFVSLFWFLFTIITLLFMLLYNGFPSIAAFNLNDVYSIRENYVSSKYVEYMLSICTTVLVPFGFAAGHILKKTRIVLFYSLAQILFFLWTGNKIYLFSILLIWAIVFILRKGCSLNYLFAGMLAISIIGCIFAMAEKGNGMNFIFSVINRRGLLEPATLKFFYFDYFLVQHHNAVGFSGTVLAPLFKNSVDTSYRYEISQTYANIRSNANTGLFGGDIAQMGFFSFIGCFFLLLLLFFYIKKTKKLCGDRFALIFYIFIVYYLNDRSIFLYLLGFSGIVLPILVFLYGLNSYTEQKGEDYEQ